MWRKKKITIQYMLQWVGCVNSRGWNSTSERRLIKRKCSRYQPFFFFSGHETAIITHRGTFVNPTGRSPYPRIATLNMSRRYAALVDELCIILSDVSVQVLTSQRLLARIASRRAFANDNGAHYTRNMRLFHEDTMDSEKGTKKKKNKQRTFFLFFAIIRSYETEF